jgi:hypothetical protein
MKQAPSTAVFEAWTGMPAASLMGWEPHGHYFGDELVAMAVMQGTEIHFAISPAFRHCVFAKHRTRFFLGPLLAKTGYLTTRTEHDKPGIVERIGFIKTWRSRHFDHYMLTNLPFGKEN